jgi:hypothetical protein
MGRPFKLTDHRKRKAIKRREQGKHLPTLGEARTSARRRFRGSPPGSEDERWHRQHGDDLLKRRRTGMGEDEKKDNEPQQSRCPSAQRAIGKDAPSIEALRIYAVSAAFVAVLIAKE